jgi:hypothetical protein
MAKACVFCAWEDAPHLTKDMKDAILMGIPPWQRQSRTKGIPSLGSGLIYPIPEEEFVISPVELLKHWPRVFSLDVGWKVNAALFGALDRETDTLYIYDEIYKANSEPAVVASAIRSRGEWIPGVIDPAARGRSVKDGTALLSIYRQFNLEIMPAVNAVEAGLSAVWERLAEGRLKVFSTCQNTIAEYRLYRRDENGKVIKQNDHAMDALRYMVMSGLQRAVTEPQIRNGRRWYDWSAEEHPWYGSYTPSKDII